MAIKIGTIDVAGVAVGETSIGSVAVGSNVVWQKVLPDPLCFTGNHNDMIRMVKVGSPDSANIEYSKDGNTWTAYTFGTWIDFDGADNKVYFRAASDNDTSFYTDSSNYYKFELDENYYATISGNLDTLLNKNGTRHATKQNTFRELFIGMRGLTDASQLELPSMTVPTLCYYGMFQNCVSLSAAPELPATTIAASCYRSMFEGCSWLVSAPSVLPATTTQQYCYSRMFYGCTMLKDAPAISATTLTTNCMQNMFSTDTNLSSVTVAFTDWQTDVTPTSYWLYQVASNGVFNCPAELSVVRGASNIPTNWEVNPAEDPWLCFTANTANSTIRLDKVGTPAAISLETSTDGTTWTDYGWTDTTGDTLTMANIGDKVYMRAKTENTTIGSSESKYYKFVGSGSFAASGNIQSLLKADCTRTDAPTYCYGYMFQGCTGLTQAPALPATTLYARCYSYMFYNCTSLTDAPELPATTIAMACYGDMFNGCSSLTKAPALPATTLTDWCYAAMFQGCTHLSSMEVSFTQWYPNNATSNWVTNAGTEASGTKTFKCPSTLSQEFGNDRIPSGWTKVDA